MLSASRLRKLTITGRSPSYNAKRYMTQDVIDSPTRDSPRVRGQRRDVKADFDQVRLEIQRRLAGGALPITGGLCELPTCGRPCATL
jgi:hypothetical protein